MKFFTFRQNNTGGAFDPAMPLRLVVEARDAAHANERAEGFGVYFDGIDAGSDCPCCGDRWYRASERDGDDDEPDTRISDFDRGYVARGRVKCVARVEYVDGREVEYA